VNRCTSVESKIADVKTRVWTRSLGQGQRERAYRLFGIRLRGGMNSERAFVRNAGGLPVMARE
jgi:hypothetical protein